MTTAKRLAAELLHNCPWLSSFPSTSDDILSSTASRALNEYTRSIYDYLAFDKLIGDVSVLLDRCLAYRKDYNDLFASALRQALDFRVYEEGSDTQIALEKAEWISELKKKESIGQTAVAAAFRQDGAPLSTPFAEASKQAAALADNYVTQETRRMALIDERWRVDKEQKLEIHDQFSEEGSPLNFKDRAGRTLRLMQQDFYEAIQKLLAAKKGIEYAFDISTSGFPINFDRALDDIVHYTRSLIRLLESKDDESSIYEHVISCRALYADDAAFEQALLNMTLNINLSQHPTGMNSAMQSFGILKGVGLSLVARGPGVLPSPALMQISCDVFPPRQVQAIGVGDSYFDYRDKVQIDGVRIDDGQGVRYDSSRSLKNIKTAGDWRINLTHPRYPFADVGEIKLPPLVHDVRLHLVMSSYTTGSGRPVALRHDPVKVPTFN